MEIESAKCECCGLREDCTQDYITRVKADFEGKWLCGLCTEAVRDEGRKKGGNGGRVDEAMKAHMSFCGKFKSNPAVRVADGMKQMLRRRSREFLPSASGSGQSSKYSRSGRNSSQVEEMIHKRLCLDLEEEEV